MSRRTPHLDPHVNAAYNPWETKVEYFVDCTVCGFRGIDAEKWQEPEQEVITFRTSGFTYAVPAGTPVEGLSVIDLNVFKETPAYAGCPFCGSPNWAWGSAPDLRW